MPKVLLLANQVFHRLLYKQQTSNSLAKFEIGNCRSEMSHNGQQGQQGGHSVLPSSLGQANVRQDQVDVSMVSQSDQEQSHGQQHSSRLATPPNFPQQQQQQQHQFGGQFGAQFGQQLQSMAASPEFLQQIGTMFMNQMAQGAGGIPTGVFNVAPNRYLAVGDTGHRPYNYNPLQQQQLHHQVQGGIATQQQSHQPVQPIIARPQQSQQRLPQQHSREPVQGAEGKEQQQQEQTEYGESLSHVLSISSDGRFMVCCNLIFLRFEDCM